MTVKELSKLYWLKEEVKRAEQKIAEQRAYIADHEQRIAEMRADLGNIGSPELSDMPKGTEVHSQVENSVLRVLAQEENLLKERETLMQDEYFLSARRVLVAEAQRDLNIYINSIPDPVLRLIFSYRFVDCYSWAEVAERMGKYEEDTVKKMCYRYLKEENANVWQ